jgi:hypothetical protein
MIAQTVDEKRNSRCQTEASMIRNVEKQALVSKFRLTYSA